MAKSQVFRQGHKFPIEVDVADPTAEEQAQIDADELERKSQNTKVIRNLLLAESDWTQVPDSPLTDTKKTEWATYRTSLRNLPSHANWPNLEEDDWPTKPS